jgi:hypothetical protein
MRRASKRKRVQETACPRRNTDGPIGINIPQSFQDEKKKS